MPAILSEQDMNEIGQSIIDDGDTKNRKYPEDLKFVIANQEKLKLLCEQYSVKAVADQLYAKNYIQCGYATFRNMLFKLNIIEKRKIYNRAQADEPREITLED